MFLDQVSLELSAGNGGNGVVAWRREKFLPKGGPCGGNGGPGGNIYLEVDETLFSLDCFRNRRKWKAENGASGGTNRRQGAKGKDLVIKVPKGTLVKDPESSAILYDLREHGEKVLFCEGGRGGLGNFFFKSPTNQAPTKCTPGKEGETKQIELELKLIADVGLVGMPNAGKSTLLSSLASINLQTGAYPFTTLNPNLSYVEFDDFSRIYIADIPGIIKGAHQDRGLGITFLKHIERTEVLTILIDLSGIDGRDPVDDLRCVLDEIQFYDSSLLEKPRIIALNKIDTEEAQQNLDKVQKHFPKEELFVISAYAGQGLEPLLEAMREKAQATLVRYI